MTRENLLETAESKYPASGVQIALQHSAAEISARAASDVRGDKLGRPEVRGKFIFMAGEKLYLRGVTYGAFRPDAQGREYQNEDVIDQDFAQMAANGINSVRIPHTMPPRALLDAAQRHELTVMAGLSAEQYIGSLADQKMSMAEIEKQVCRRANECAGHPALLGYALGNEVPASLVRWLGPAWVENYLERLYRAVKREEIPRDWSAM